MTAGRSNRRGPLWAFASGLALALALAFACAGTATATEPIGAFETTTSTTQAGGHPDLTASFSLENPGKPEAAQNVTVETPQGLFGNPNAIPQCTSVAFATEECPPTSQAGLITVHALYEGNPNYLLGTAPVYDLQPSESQTALFGFIVPTLDIPIQIPVSVRTGSDYGLRFNVAEITQVTPLASARITFWGFPADNVHAAERFPKGAPGRPAGCAELADTSCLSTPTELTITPHPLTDNPIVCTGAPLVTKLKVQTYQDPEHLSEREATYPETTGCEKVVFKPLLYSKPTSSETDSPSGLDITLKDEQFLGYAVSPSQIRDSAVTLPPGLTINPDAADGQTACTDAQARFGTEEPAECPDSSKIGTVTLHTVALSGPLPGSLYIGEPLPGNQYRLFLVVSGFGINAKLVGVVRPNPQTGQVTVYFEELPQVPFDTFEIHLFSSDRGLMATPTVCTIYKTQASFVPWDALLPEVSSAQTFGLTSGPHGTSCPGQVRPFNPTQVAGTSNPVAGAHSSFALKLEREDGDQYLGKLNFTMPPGLSADLHGVTYCPDAAIVAAANTPGRVERANPSCPASSEIGVSNVAAGPGSHPFHATGKIYMAGPFQGAPLSLVVVTPALAGPYDYGTVVVRVALNIDQHDAHVIADSETVPQIIGGIPLRLRSIEVNINRPNFMLNPTNCSPFSVKSQGIGDQGTAAEFSSYFHVNNCQTMPFKPTMKIRQLGGKGQTKRAKDPSMQFDLNTRPGDANIKSVAVTLPKAFAIDQRHLGNICSKAELAATRCAGRAPIGTVSTETPLLEKPLSGLAYAVSGFGKLPHLAFILGGQVMLIPEAESSSVQGGHLKTVVPVVPDAPIGHFRLTLYGGKRGYLTNTRSLCASAAVTTVEYVAQSGKKLTQRVTTQTACKAKGKTS
ncbi:MAG: hypothetical protein JSU06_01310 [Actinobacteria bacterium]|nr:hypothetical protein [Actinomycetota bacterium]